MRRIAIASLAAAAVLATTPAHATDQITMWWSLPEGSVITGPTSVDESKVRIWPQTPATAASCGPLQFDTYSGGDLAGLKADLLADGKLTLIDGRPEDEVKAPKYGVTVVSWGFKQGPACTTPKPSVTPSASVAPSVTPSSAKPSTPASTKPSSAKPSATTPTPSSATPSVAATGSQPRETPSSLASSSAPVAPMASASVPTLAATGAGDYAAPLFAAGALLVVGGSAVIIGRRASKRGA